MGASLLKVVGAGCVSVALIVAVACAQSEAGATSQEAETVEGLIVNVVARNIDEFETMVIKDSGGKVWTFTSEGFAGVPPAQLREHQLFGDSVTVTYHEKDGPEGRVLVATDVTD